MLQERFRIPIRMPHFLAEDRYLAGERTLMMYDRPVGNSGGSLRLSPGTRLLRVGGLEGAVVIVRPPVDRRFTRHLVHTTTGIQERALMCKHDVSFFSFILGILSLRLLATTETLG